MLQHHKQTILKSTAAIWSLNLSKSSCNVLLQTKTINKMQAENQVRITWDRPRLRESHIVSDSKGVSYQDIRTEVFQDSNMVLGQLKAHQYIPVVFPPDWYYTANCMHAPSEGYKPTWCALTELKLHYCASRKCWAETALLGNNNGTPYSCTLPGVHSTKVLFGHVKMLSKVYYSQQQANEHTFWKKSHISTLASWKTPSYLASSFFSITFTES